MRLLAAAMAAVCALAPAAAFEYAVVCDAGSTGMTGDLAPGFYSTDEELVTLAKAVAKVNKGMIFQCISQMSSNDRPEGFEDPMALIRPEDGTHRGMDWMRAISKLGLTVIHPLNLRSGRAPLSEK